MAGYINFLKKHVPTLDDVIEQYILEALTAFNRDAYFAAAVMAGAASEKAIYLLAVSLLEKRAKAFTPTCHTGSGAGSSDNYLHWKLPRGRRLKIVRRQSIADSLFGIGRCYRSLGFALRSNPHPAKRCSPSGKGDRICVICTAVLVLSSLCLGTTEKLGGWLTLPFQSLGVPAAQPVESS